jgi:hypothetical protein
MARSETPEKKKDECGMHKKVQHVVNLVVCSTLVTHASYPVGYITSLEKTGCHWLQLVFGWSADF